MSKNVLKIDSSEILYYIYERYTLIITVIIISIIHAFS